MTATRGPEVDFGTAQSLISTACRTFEFKEILGEQDKTPATFIQTRSFLVYGPKNILGLAELSMRSGLIRLCIESTELGPTEQDGIETEISLGADTRDPNNPSGNVQMYRSDYPAEEPLRGAAAGSRVQAYLKDLHISHLGGNLVLLPR